MFRIDTDGTMNLTRGDVANIKVSAKDSTGASYTFYKGDTLRFQIMTAKKCDDIVLTKTITIPSITNTVSISLTSSETRIGDLISKPVTYWYEIELNPTSQPQTIIGYDENGPKLFILYPEGQT